MSDPQIPPTRPTVNRREVLKTLAAAGGALAAGAFLPAHWSRPLVEAGVLPAHAQGSACNGPFNFAGCAVTHIYWGEAPEYFNLSVYSEGRISPACSGVRLCFTVRWLAGVGVVDEQQIYCDQTDESGGYTANTVMSGLAFFELNPSPTRVEIQAGFENPEFGQQTCSTFAEIPPYPED